MRAICFGIILCVASAPLILSCTPVKQNTSMDGDKRPDVAVGGLPIDRCFFYIEGEAYKDKSGGDLDYKSGAFRNKCLGMRWGQKKTDFVTYDVNVEAPSPSTIMVLRAAFENQVTQSYEILLDNREAAQAVFSPTGGYGYIAKEWKWFSIALGQIDKGPHTLTIKPSRSGEIINIDCFALGWAE
jgi:hypothetical protein